MTSISASNMEAGTSEQVTRSYLDSQFNKMCERFDN